MVETKSKRPRNKAKDRNKKLRWPNAFPETDNFTKIVPLLISWSVLVAPFCLLLLHCAPPLETAIAFSTSSTSNFLCVCVVCVVSGEPRSMTICGFLFCAARSAAQRRAQEHKKLDHRQRSFNTALFLLFCSFFFCWSWLSFKWVVSSIVSFCFSHLCPQFKQRFVHRQFWCFVLVLSPREGIPVSLT